MKTLYKPLGLIVGVLGGVAANAVFSKVWGKLTGEDEAPNATAPDHTWREVVIAAALQGAIFGAVKAAVDRAGARGYQSLTGTWPG
ncbi:DUF4235 domain-containing protein [Nocardia farcinica]|uniref:DUF4235 domain-containing protein n=2 Tax=Nocardia farcinica TaxID=37329 RepID=Q5YXC1_NOCFA|nr:MULTISPECIES: DUF4235 domain-containing protein [Nocardia]AXK85132.1 DUF4235 domain-containing protein [Nocardia farcinica]MBA4855545.1 DUF4235 domain-containing protein [Nocardia farcinica]MBC9818116.1 DUF4235 domain-containing protein [Nocardia farcinica]MBF6067841.1 DUF4235 domain-containing protein [Nocardia farcinica]MBF6140309.1 DUF4235 domain-containing protein [Nocardia farcinica]